MEKVFWTVKVYDNKSGTTTCVDTEASSEDEAKENVENDGWIFVSAYVSQYQ